MREETFWGVEHDLVGLDWEEVGKSFIGQLPLLVVYGFFVHTVLEIFGSMQDA